MAQRRSVSVGLPRGCASYWDSGDLGVPLMASPIPRSARDPPYAAIPEELRARPQWIAWWSVAGEGRPVRLPNGRSTDVLKVQAKPHKLPIDPRTGGLAASTRLATWSSVGDALTAVERWSVTGIGFVFAGSDPYTGIDIDNCRNPETSQIAEWVREIIRELNSYTEVSPSGTGVHIIIRGNLPPGKGNQVAHYDGKVEMFSRARYFTITGIHVDGTPIEILDRQTELLAFHHQLFASRITPDAEEYSAASSSLLASDDELVAKARHAQNGSKFERLWNGQWEGDYPSQSEADLALCCLLAFWTSKDRARMDGLFRGSGLMRKKWLREDYREDTLAKAIAMTDGTWDAGQTARPNRSAARGGSVAAAPHVPADPEWPTQLQPEALCGLVGEVVETLDPHTEADPAALLVQFLIAFGNVVGRVPYFPAGADRHFPNEFGVLVGASSKGRKGSSWSTIEHVLGMADAEWLNSCVQTGLSSGEGLIWAVRDQIDGTEPVRAGKGKRVTEYRTVIKDPGVSDKRLMVVEPEFASPLRVSERDGNTLSAVVRQSWDTGRLRALTKNSPARATGAHISIVGHVTKDELLKYLTDSEAGNGFANRFLWVAVRRSKLLPDGGRLHTVNFAPLIRRLTDALGFARTVGTMNRDEEAGELWNEAYGQLTRDRVGLYGAVTSRAEAHTLRLSCLYALLDRSTAVRVPHLAALEVWRFCEDSCRFIFGDSLGDVTADTIRAALRRNPTGLTRTEISSLFDRHKRAEQVTRALELLRNLGFARSFEKRTKGRPLEYWVAVA